MAKKQTNHPDEQRLAGLIKELRSKMGDEPTEGQKKQLADYKRKLGEAKFQRLAVKRVSAAIKQIRNVGKLAGGNYAHSADQADQISKALAKEVDAVHTAMNRTPEGKKSVPQFAFS